MAPVSQELEPPGNPARFSPGKQDHSARQFLESRHDLELGGFWLGDDRLHPSVVLDPDPATLISSRPLLLPRPHKSLRSGSGNFTASTEATRSRSGALAEEQSLFPP